MFPEGRFQLKDFPLEQALWDTDEFLATGGIQEESSLSGIRALPENLRCTGRALLREGSGKGVSSSTFLGLPERTEAGRMGSGAWASPIPLPSGAGPSLSLQSALYLS